MSSMPPGVVLSTTVSIFSAMPIVLSTAVSSSTRQNSRLNVLDTARCSLIYDGFYIFGYTYRLIYRRVVFFIIECIAWSIGQYRTLVSSITLLLPRRTTTPRGQEQLFEGNNNLLVYIRVRVDNVYNGFLYTRVARSRGSQRIVNVLVAFCLSTNCRLITKISLQPYLAAITTIKLYYYDY